MLYKSMFPLVEGDMLLITIKGTN